LKRSLICPSTSLPRTSLLPALGYFFLFHFTSFRVPAWFKKSSSSHPKFKIQNPKSKIQNPPPPSGLNSAGLIEIRWLAFTRIPCSFIL